ncbi:MAG: hypothetical protein KDE27_14385, partial [Planctomycetes bacterium]|nr:hypothetical protein [Planctomycetota bacterium]
MRLSPIAPGHVVLRDPLWPRWLLLALAVGLAVPAIGLAFTLDFRGAPTLAAALAFTLLAGGVAAVSCRRAFELGPDGALRCRGPFRRRFAAAGRVAAVRLAAVRRAVAAGQYI